jgi:hypothetical protein
MAPIKVTSLIMAISLTTFFHVRTHGFELTGIENSLIYSLFCFFMIMFFLKRSVLKGIEDDEEKNKKT